MKDLLKRVWNWFRNIFTKDENQSEILKILINNTSDANALIIKDKELSQKAIEIVKNLNKSETLTSKEKAELFNQMFAEYLVSVGKTIAKSAINLLRELAVTAVKIVATSVVTSLLTVDCQESKKEK